MTDLDPGVLRGGFDGLYGLEGLEMDGESVRARVTVRDELKQPGGIVHGGVHCAIAEGITSVATYLAVHEEGRVAMGMSNQTSFLRPISAGAIHASARAVHRGSTTWVWEAEMRDDAGRLCAVSRVTVAVRELPARR